MAVSAGAVSPRSIPDIKAFNYNFHLGEEILYVPLSNPNGLLSLNGFDRSKPFVILITGWTTNANDSENAALSLIYTAYRCRGDVNFAIIDTAGYIDSLYTWSAFNTEYVGKLIADSLVGLSKNYSQENIHLIGHSLGAHIAGSTGRNFYYQTDETLPRITGLDPASKNQHFFF